MTTTTTTMVARGYLARTTHAHWPPIGECVSSSRRPRLVCSARTLVRLWSRTHLDSRHPPYSSIDSSWTRTSARAASHSSSFSCVRRAASTTTSHSSSCPPIQAASWPSLCATWRVIKSRSPPPPPPPPRPRPLSSKCKCEWWSKARRRSRLSERAAPTRCTLPWAVIAECARSTAAWCSWGHRWRPCASASSLSRPAKSTWRGATKATTPHECPTWSPSSRRATTRARTF